MFESFNGFIIGARYKSIISLLEYISKLVIKRIVERWKFMEKGFKEEFGSRIWIKVKENISECNKFIVTWNATNGGQ